MKEEENRGNVGKESGDASEETPDDSKIVCPICYTSFYSRKVWKIDVLTFAECYLDI